jgi:hypothetical protein
LGALAIRFSLRHKEAEQELYEQAIAQRNIAATPGSDPAMA